MGFSGIDAQGGSKRGFQRESYQTLVRVLEIICLALSPPKNLTESSKMCLKHSAALCSEIMLNGLHDAELWGFEDWGLIRFS